LNTISNRLQQNELLDVNIQLSKIGQLKNGYAFRSNTYEEEGEYRILTIANVKGERYVDSDSCHSISELPLDIQDHQILKTNDILISLTGNVGRVSLCKEGLYLLNQRVGLFELNQGVNREYIYQTLCNKRFEQAMTFCGQGAAQMNIGKGDVENYSIPYSYSPKVLENFANALKAFDEKINLESRYRQQLYCQKQYLLDQLFI
jgi:type I restriction enzyme S subunit